MSFVHPSLHIIFVSLSIQARLSNVVEAEPDCRVAMDILGFALYHENNGDVAGATQKVEKASDITDDSDSSVGDDEIGNKRMRLDEEGTSSKSGPVKVQVWDKIVSAGGEVPLEEVCAAMDDRDEVMEAVDEMVKEGRVYVSDGNLYQIDD